MTYSTSSNENLSNEDRQFALQALWNAIKTAMSRMTRKAENLTKWLQIHSNATIQKFKTKEGIEALLISTGSALFVGSLVYNTIVAVATQQLLASLTIVAAKVIVGLIAAGASVLLAHLAGIAAIGIVPLGIGVSGPTFLAAIGGIAGAWGSGTIVSSILAPSLATKILIATGIATAPFGAPIAVISAGLITGGLALWSIKKLLTKKESDSNRKNIINKENI